MRLQDIIDANGGVLPRLAGADGSTDEDEDGAGSEPTPEQQLETAKAEATKARDEAEKAKADGQAALAQAAEQRAAAADVQAAAAEKRAKDAAAAKADDGSKKYSEDYVKKLRDEAAKHRVSANDVRGELKKLQDAAKTEAERVAGVLKDSDIARETAEQKLLKIEVAIAKKIPLELAQRLVGSSKEELEADADELLKDVKPATGQGLDQGSRGDEGGGTQSGDMNQWMRKRSGITR